jgi:non-heme chloroperoxidase
MPFITGSGDTQLFYVDWGRGRPVLLLHGWALNHQMWENQVAFLTLRGFRCVTYDRRGHGRSDVPSTGYDYDTLAADLDAVLNGLDLSDVLLVAHSMAAGEAVRYLSRNPDGIRPSGRVTGLVLIGATTPCRRLRPRTPTAFPPSCSQPRPHS